LLELLQVTHSVSAGEAQKKSAPASRFHETLFHHPSFPPIMTTRYDDLSGLLQTWQPEALPGTDFHRHVWARIEAAESRKGDRFASLLSWLQELARPRIAVSAAAIALFGGVLLGSLQARSSQEEQYLRSLNPYHAGSVQLPRR
jgi:hypothetical protein